MIKKSKDKNQEFPGNKSDPVNGNGQSEVGGGKGNAPPADEQDVSVLRRQLQEEISRLQNQFKHQKLIEKKLENEQKKYKQETEKLSFKRQEPVGIPSTGVGIPSGRPGFVPDAARGAVQSTGGAMQPPEGSYEIFERIENEIKDLKLKLDKKVDEEYVNELISQTQELSKINEKFTDFSKLIITTKKDLKKVDIKLTEVLEDIGYEESMDIGKVPPEILESVYETIIDDAIERIKHDLGVHDTEVVITQTLEEIRFRTSGSELFKYENGKLKLKNLGKYIDQKSISAKQIHTTFKELISKLTERVPDYEPKNFKAMIKIKSQEFSLDRVTGISDQFKGIEKNITNLQNQMDNFNKNLIELENTKTMMLTEIKNFNLRVVDIAKRVDGVESLKPKVQPKETLKEDEVKPKVEKSKEKEKKEKPKEEKKKEDKGKGGESKIKEDKKTPEGVKKPTVVKEKGKK
jgi:hypothetical protein